MMICSTEFIAIDCDIITVESSVPINNIAIVSFDDSRSTLIGDPINSMNNTFIKCAWLSLKYAEYQCNIKSNYPFHRL